MQRPLSQSHRWAGSTGVLGAIGCWVAQAGSRGPSAGPARSSSQRLDCPGAPGPVYARAGTATSTYAEWAAALSGAPVRHVSLASGDPAGLPIAVAGLGLAVEAGAVLVSDDGPAATVWVPSVDPAAHRPTIVLTAVDLTDHGRAATVPGAESAAGAGGDARLATHRAAYRQSLLSALAGLEAAGVTLFSVSTPPTLRLPPLPTPVEAATRDAIATVLAVCAALDRARESAHSTSAGAAAKRRLLEIVGETGELQRCARAYLDALWTAAIRACAGA